MLSRPFDKALQLKPRASATLVVLLVFLHLIAMLSVVAVILESHRILFLLIPILSYSAYYTIRKYALLSLRSSVIGISQSTDGDWSLRLYDQSELHVVLCDDSYVHPLMVILNFKITNSYRRLSLPLFRDALDAEPHRQLRSRLKLSRPAEKEKLLRR